MKKTTKTKTENITNCIVCTEELTDDLDLDTGICNKCATENRCGRCGKVLINNEFVICENCKKPKEEMPNEKND